MIRVPYEQFDPFARDKTKVGKAAWCQDEDGYVFVRCPNCCIPATLGDKHSIDSAGNVVPSMWCKCTGGGGQSLALGGELDWHVFGTLKEWTDDHARKRMEAT